MKINWINVSESNASGVADGRRINIATALDFKRNVCSLRVVAAQKKYDDCVECKDQVFKEFDCSIDIKYILANFPSYFNALIQEAINKATS
jgi:hypothetical protein